MGAGARIELGDPDAIRGADRDDEDDNHQRPLIVLVFPGLFDLFISLASALS